MWCTLEKEQSQHLPCCASVQIRLAQILSGGAAGAVGPWCSCSLRLLPLEPEAPRPVCLESTHICSTVLPCIRLRDVQHLAFGCVFSLRHASMRPLLGTSMENWGLGMRAIILLQRSLALLRPRKSLEWHRYHSSAERKPKARRVRSARVLHAGPATIAAESDVSNTPTGPFNPPNPTPGPCR